MDHRLIEGLMEAIAPLIKSYVDERIAKEVEPLRARIKEFEASEPLKGEPGKDADPEVVKDLVIKAIDLDAIAAQVLEKVPVPENGKDGRDGVDGESVTAEDVALKLMDHISITISHEVAKIKPPSGKDGSSVTVEDVVPVLQSMVDALPKAENGKDGKDADPVEVAALIVEDVAKLIPKPEDGKSVTVEDLIPIVQETVAKAVAAVPPAKDGAPGKDGVGLAGGVINRDGELVLMLSDGSTKAAGVVVGKDVDMDEVVRLINEKFAEVPIPKDGRDGVGFDDMDVLYDGERTITLKFTRGDYVKESSFKMPIVLERGVYREGQEYDKGDGVTSGGSFWIAQKDKPEGSPRDGSKDWRLSVKRGRNGADGVARPPTPQGPVKAS